MKHPNTARCLSAICALALACTLAAGCARQSPSEGGGGDPSNSGNGGASSRTAARVTLLDPAAQFDSRDLEQTPDLTGATFITVETGRDVAITEGGTYILTGKAGNLTITVQAPEDADVQLVLDGLVATNADKPVISVRTAARVFVTTTAHSTNSLSVTGTFTSGTAIIHSNVDLVFGGSGTLKLTAGKGKGIRCNGDVKFTGGTYIIRASKHAIEADDSIRVCGGTLTVTSIEKDGFHVKSADGRGYTYISGGNLTIKAANDGISSDGFVLIDGGTLDLAGYECIEATYVQINGGSIRISATDDGINADSISAAYATTVEITGGELSITMGPGDTDGIDSNGDLYISGGTITVSGPSAFDWDNEALMTGGSVTVNGAKVTELSNQFDGFTSGVGGGR